MPAARARTWATRDASSRPGSSVIRPTSPGVTVTTPTSVGGMPPAGPAGAVLEGPQPASMAARLRELKASRPVNLELWFRGAELERRAHCEVMVGFQKKDREMSSRQSHGLKVCVKIIHTVMNV